VESSYIITFIGDDRPGLVESVAKVVEENRGNWQQSQLSQLGGKFAGLVLVSLPEGHGEQLELALQELSQSGLSVRVTPSGTVHSNASSASITLSIIGPDRAGIVREVSQALAKHDVNVVSMDSGVESAPMSSEKLFRAGIKAEIPVDTNREDLLDIMDYIANEMTLDIVIEPV
jgi:glycine cleavage system regulatory protein